MTEIHSYEHRGKVVGLAWSADGSQLFSASFDGAIRAWRKNKIETIREPGAPVENVDTFDETIWSLDWSTTQSGLITAEKPGIVFSDINSLPKLVGKGISAVEVKCSPTNSLVALREMISTDDGKQSKPRLRIRSLDSLTEDPMLDSNVFHDADWWTYDIAWTPTGSLLAVLAGGAVTFWLPGQRTVSLQRWVLGRWANAIAWLSDNELAAAYGDGNVRIFDRPEYGAGDNHPNCKAVLEAHDAFISSISVGMTGQQFATADTDGCICIWDRSQTLVTKKPIGMAGVTGGLRISFNPRLPILAYAQNARVGLLLIENEDLAQPAAVVPINAPTSSLDKLLQASGLLQPRMLSSDEVAGLWGIEAVQEKAIDALLFTKQLRRIRVANKLDLLLCEAIRQAWIKPTHQEVLDLEDIEIGAYRADDRDTTRHKICLLLAKAATGPDRRVYRRWPDRHQ